MRWNTQLITPNRLEAQAEYDAWVAKGYHSHFKAGGHLVEIKRGGPNKALFFVRTRIAPVKEYDTP